MKILTTLFDLGRSSLRGPKIFFALVGWVAAMTTLQAAYEGPVLAPMDRFGQPGPYSVTVDTIPSPGWPGHQVTVFRPKGAPGHRPTWFFAHGFLGTDPNYYGDLLNHLASHGSVVIFSPYPNDLNPTFDYPIIFDGFAAAVAQFADSIDTTRVGYAGHSYGGGAVPALAQMGLQQHGWGSSQLALFLMAPWYSYQIGEDVTLPSYTQALIEVYEDDTTNDHRMAIDLFNHFIVPAKNKNYLMMRSDRIDGYNYNADHRTPTGPATPDGTSPFNALDSWGILRLCEALSLSAFEGDPLARAVALGRGSPDQIDMGRTTDGRALRRMVYFDAPVPLFPSSRYLQPWNGKLNPRGGDLPVPDNRSHILSFSIQAFGGMGSDTLTVEAYLTGSRPKSLLVRGVGPTLATLGIDQPMPNPALTMLHGKSTDIVLDDWAQSPGTNALAATTSETGAFPLLPDSKDAALLASFHGRFTAQVTPSDGAAGTALVELYDADDDASTRITKASGQARLGQGNDVMTTGFVIGGQKSLTLLLRAVGPSLSSVSSSERLADPTLTVFREDQQIAANDNWSDDASQTANFNATFSKVSASLLPSGSKDACIILTLPPGSYTAQIHSQDGSAGISALELYVLP